MVVSNTLSQKMAKIAKWPMAGGYCLAGVKVIFLSA